MELIEHYFLLRHLHIGLVAASGTLFALRAAAHLAGANWPLARPARVASWVIDTGLLAAGIALWAALRIDPFGQPWLGTKLLLLLLYIGLGTMALRRAQTLATRAAWTAAALACFGFIVTVALAHHPLGLLSSR
ncbi:MAG: SirB2 family protein [Rubrivivax sp.]|nr:SirB2 family protein [Rubrivivax sp.]MDP3221528.1 SirB2 family protein [Rubrivivax sp.]MDP3612446.1 SirB2 family protein [Rubrivivax sp.]